MKVMLEVCCLVFGVMCADAFRNSRAVARSWFGCYPTGSGLGVKGGISYAVNQGFVGRIAGNVMFGSRFGMHGTVVVVRPGAVPMFGFF